MDFNPEETEILSAMAKTKNISVKQLLKKLVINKMDHRKQLERKREIHSILGRFEKAVTDRGVEMSLEEINREIEAYRNGN